MFTVSQIGSHLREARESQNLTLAQVEEATRIRHALLEALEEERFDDLPGDVYARGFIRNYGRYLGLDTAELLRDYHHVRQDTPVSVPSVLDEPLTRRGALQSWHSVIVGFVTILLLGLVGWYAYNRFYLKVDLLESLWPLTRPTASLGAPTLIPLTPTTPVEPTSTPVQVEAQQLTPTPKEQSAMRVPTATRLTQAAPTATARPTELEPTRLAPSPTMAISVGIEVHVRLLAPTYFEIDSDGESIYAGILDEGAKQIWTASKEIKLLIGNAGGVEITVNGVTLDPLGESGEIVELEYTLDTLPEG